MNDFYYITYSLRMLKKANSNILPFRMLKAEAEIFVKRYKKYKNRNILKVKQAIFLIEFMISIDVNKNEKPKAV